MHAPMHAPMHALMAARMHALIHVMMHVLMAACSWPRAPGRRPPYDVLLDDFEKGMTSARLDEIFAQARAVSKEY